MVSGGQFRAQIAQTFADQRRNGPLEAGFLWHKITRENASMGLRAEIINFVPPTEVRSN